MKNSGSPEGQSNRNQNDCDDVFIFVGEDEDDEGHQPECHGPRDNDKIEKGNVWKYQFHGKETCVRVQ